MNLNFSKTYLKKLKKIYKESQELEDEIGGTFNYNTKGEIIELDSKGTGTSMKYFQEHYFPYTFHTHPPIKSFDWYPPSGVDLLNTLTWGSHPKYKDDGYEVIYSELEFVITKGKIFIYQASEDLREKFQNLDHEDKKRIYDLIEFYLEVKANLVMNDKIPIEKYLNSLKEIDLNYILNFLKRNPSWCKYWDDERENFGTLCLFCKDFIKTFDEYKGSKLFKGFEINLLNF